MSTGTLKWFSRARGFGFIVPDDGSRDVFFHLTALEPGTSTEDGALLDYELAAPRPDGKVRANKVWGHR